MTMDISTLVEEKNPWWKDAAARAARSYPIRRSLQRRVIQHVERLADRRAVVLMGPRQVGKTVLLKQTVDDLLEAGWPPQNITYFDFSDDRIRSADRISPRDIVDVRPQGHSPAYPRVLLLDEIRLAQAWDGCLKQAVDAEVARIVVTDSAASLARSGSRESGLGRWDEFRLEGLTFREFVDLNGSPGETAEGTSRRIPNIVERYLQLGGFPEHAASDDEAQARERLRQDTVDRAILRDLLHFGIDVQRAKDLFVYLVQASGSIFVAKPRADDLHADPRTVTEWLRLLEETLLVALLPKFTGRPAVSLRSRPRVYAADHGLVGAFSVAPWATDVRDRSFEAVTFRHLREVAREHAGTLGYFRNHRGTLEADFVLATEQRRVVVEVTGSARIRPEKLDTMHKVGDILEADHLLLVHGGLRNEIESGVRLLPLPAFLMAPKAVLEEST